MCIGQGFALQQMVLVVATIFGRSLLNVILMFGVTDAPVLIRLVRGEVLRIRQADYILAERLHCWRMYHEAFAAVEKRGMAQRPFVPDYCAHNAHLYYLLLNSPQERTRFIERLHRQGIGTVFHYVPLHSARAGRRYGRVVGRMDVTDRAGECLVRLPLWLGAAPHLPEIIDASYEALSATASRAA